MFDSEWGYTPQDTSDAKPVGFPGFTTLAQRTGGNYDREPLNTSLACMPIVPLSELESLMVTNALMTSHLIYHNGAALEEHLKTATAPEYIAAWGTFVIHFYKTAVLQALLASSGLPGAI